MNYPLISEYIESIKNAEENFEQLKHLRPVLDDDGQPVMSSGNFAVVFKMKDENTGKLYAVKCFLKEQEGRTEAYRMIAEELEFVSSTFLTPIKYLNKELFVDTSNSDESEFPVLLMDWVEGQTLDKYIRDHIDDQYELSLLAYQFSRLAMWLLPQPFAHGDLKPDNILVKDDGTLVLVDYDGMYVPAMKGQKARELGSPDFRHPGRTEIDFNEHIDDFSLVSILLSLKAIALQPELLEQYGASDRLLFSENDYRNLSESLVMDAIKAMMQDTELASLYSLFILASSQNNLSMVSFRLFNLSRPDRTQFEKEKLSTEVTEEDLVNAWTDEYGVQYSKDRKRLLKAPSDLKEYRIIEGTKVICNGYADFYDWGRKAKSAFCECKSLESIVIPKTVVKIGHSAFYGCNSLKQIIIPDSVTTIDDFAFSWCYSLKQIRIPESVQKIGENAFNTCGALKQVTIPRSINSLRKGVFAYCTSLQEIIIPNTVINIEDSAFEGCTELKQIVIPNSVRYIGNSAFKSCKSLCHIDLPMSISKISDDMFSNCTSLEKVVIPNTISDIGQFAFYECISLGSISISSRVVKIGKGAFSTRSPKPIQIFIPMGTKSKFETLLPFDSNKLIEIKN